jgi:membrane-associated phospholipid phosphatase
VSSICFYAWYEYSKVRPSWETKIVAVAAFVIGAGVILSTMFIKQHYVVDEIAGIVLALCVGRPLFSRLWKPFTPRRSRTQKKK